MPTAHKPNPEHEHVHYGLSYSVTKINLTENSWEGDTSILYPWSPGLWHVHSQLLQRCIKFLDNIFCSPNRDTARNKRFFPLLAEWIVEYLKNVFLLDGPVYPVLIELLDLAFGQCECKCTCCHSITVLYIGLYCILTIMNFLLKHFNYNMQTTKRKTNTVFV